MKFPALDFSDGADVHVWHIDLATSGIAHFVDMFSADEIKRRDGFFFDRDRDRYTRARTAMRCILSAYLGVLAGDVKFGVGPHGKPFLAGFASSRGLQFNITHSGNLALLALSGEAAVGIDVEMLRRPDDIRSLAKSVFSIAENAQFATLSDEALVAAFFSCWTQKEAVLKALGTGLSIDARCIDVGFDVAHKKITVPSSCAQQAISVRTILQNDAAIASLAVVGNYGGVLHFDYSKPVFDTIINKLDVENQR